MEKNIENSFNEAPTLLSKAIVLLLPVIAFLATIGYGAVDAWALGLLVFGAALLAVLWLLDAFLRRELTFSTNLLQLPLIGLILIGIIQILPIGSSPVAPDLLSIPAANTLSIDPNSTRMAVITLVVYLIFFAASLTFINSESRVRKMVFAVIIFGSMMAFMGIIQFLTGTESIYGLRTNSGTSPFGSYANKHHFAALMEMIIGLTLSLLYGEATKKDKRLLLIIAVVLMGICILLTGSRGGLLSLLIVVGFVTLFSIFGKRSEHRKSEKSGNKFVWVGVSAGLMTILLAAALFLGGGTDIRRGVGLTTMQDVSMGRFHFWSIATQVIKDNPIIGTGLDTFGMIFTKHDTWNGAMRVEQAHNDYLQIFSDAGILGFICAVAFVIILFRQSLSVINQSTDRFRRGVAIGALAGCLGILFHSFFDFPLRTVSNPFIFLILITLAVVPISTGGRERV